MKIAHCPMSGTHFRSFGSTGFVCLAISFLPFTLLALTLYTFIFLVTLDIRIYTMTHKEKLTKDYPFTFHSIAGAIEHSTSTYLSLTHTHLASFCCAVLIVCSWMLMVKTHKICYSFYLFLQSIFILIHPYV